MIIQGSYCKTAYGNTGVGNCGFDLEQLEGFILMDKSKTYDPATYATEALFLAALQADAIKAVKATRIYPYLCAKGATDATADNSIKESDYGQTMDVYHESPRWTIRLDDRGLIQLSNLDMWRHNRNAAIVPVFKGGKGNSVIMFVRDSAGLLTPAECVVYGNKAGIAAKNRADKTITVEFTDNEIFFGAASNLEFLQLSTGTKLSRNLHGVHNVALKVASASTTAITVAAVDANSGEILGDTYETAMEQAGVFNINLVSSGAVVSISSTTWNSTTKLFTLAGTFTTAAHVLTLGTPEAMAALSTPFGNGITGGFEADPVTFTPA